MLTKVNYIIYYYFRYNLQKEYFGNWRSLVFQPSPFYHVIYGTVFHDLLRARESFMTYLSDRTNSYYTITAGNMPPFTLVLQEVNLPIYHFTEFVQVRLASTDLTKSTSTSLVPSYPVNNYKTDRSYYPYGTNNIEDNTNRAANNVLSLEYNVNSTQTQSQPRKKNKKSTIVELPADNEAVPGCSNSQPQPSTSSVDTSVFDFNQFDNPLFWQTVEKSLHAFEKQTEWDFLKNQQFMDSNKFNNNWFFNSIVVMTTYYWYTPYL